MRGAPSIAGHLFYNSDMSGFNFDQGKALLSASFEFLLQQLRENPPSSLAIQSVPCRENLPGFEEENSQPLIEGVEPRVWIGNQVTVAAHHDPVENIACVTAGRRRFTLLPPDQIGNLYLGPFELTPAGTPISLVDFDAPDFARFPRFRAALDAAYEADLGPGDAIYIPYMWWHHVRSLERFNMLVNYWWAPPTHGRGAPREAFLHALLSVKELQPTHREAWRALFEHYVFKANGEPSAHLPPERTGILGKLTPDAIRALRASIARALAPKK